MRHLYTFLLRLLLPFIFLRLYWRGRLNKKYRHRWEERLGFIGDNKKLSNKTIWIHAVSVGEAEATVTFVRKLFEEFSDLQIVMTTTTPTGAETVKRRYTDQILHNRLIHLYTPYDLPGILKRFLNTVNPKLVIVMETEVWPNMVYTCQEKSIPLILANARMAERSYKGYKRLGSLARQTFSKISTIAAQTDQDAERLIALGADTENVTVSGSLKFDLSIPIDLKEKSNILRDEIGRARPVWIAGSTHDGEEEQVLTAHQKILKKIPDSLLILVPRHPERFDQVYALCHKNFGMKTTRRSQGGSMAGSSKDDQVYLVDTMGDLLLCYGAADVVFVAGSLTEIGGHNILEPASLSLPVLMGPYTFKIEQIFQDFLDAEAAIRVQNSSELSEEVMRLLENEDLRTQIGNNAKDLVESRQGAVVTLLTIVRKHIV